PFGDSSALALYVLCGEVARNVKVVLSGDGSDELFAGYRRHEALMRILEPGVAEQLASWTGKIIPGNPGRESTLANKLRQVQRYARLSELRGSDLYSGVSRFVDEQELMGIGKGVSEPQFGYITPHSGLKEFLRQDQEFILPGDMLVKTDRMSMAHGLEIRTPFLDHRVVEWARGRSSNALRNKAQGKLPLRSEFGHLLPAEVFDRPKHGFEIPLQSWLSGPLKTQVSDALEEGRFVALPFMSPSAIRSIRTAYIKGTFNPSLIWTLYVLSEWMHRNHR
ncbi:MAG: hypothetical protein KDC12_07220, partial [Flavobacteriales bacterium]|nr:hypothetical protein [Flavobacteriales bacterium]